MPGIRRARSLRQRTTPVLSRKRYRQRASTWSVRATSTRTPCAAHSYIYLSGYGLQLEGENYFAPIDARIARDTDVPLEAIRISDYVRPLAALNLKATVVVLDVARASPFARSGSPLAGGL